jgi:hypothetical protein
MTAFPPLTRIASFLTREVTEAERETVPSYREMPSHLLQELRDVRKRCGRIAALRYLQFFVGRENERRAPDFIEDVVENPNAVASRWQIFDTVIVAKLPIVSATVAAYLSVFDELDGERWYRLVSEPLQLGVPDDGAPGILLRDYYWYGPTPWRGESQDRPYVGRIQQCSRRDNNRLEEIPEAELPIAVRRWLAREIASHFRFTNLQPPYTYHAIRESLRSYSWPVRSDDGRDRTLITDIEPSADILIAIDALVKESQLPGADFPNSAGFLGPDDWYR